MTLPQIGDVEIWSAKNDVSTETLSALERTLSIEERRRRDKFKFQTYRNAYIFSQGVLRTILAQYLSAGASEIEFRINEYGKPFLSNSISTASVMFNMSHSGSVVLIAITRNHLVGVDVESIRAIDDMERIASRHFTVGERQLLNAAHSKEYAFYTCWTRKEAFIKAVGKGLSIPLPSFDTSMPFVALGHQFAFTADSPEMLRWWLSDLQVLQGYAAAVVLQGDAHHIIYRTWTDANAMFAAP